MEYEENNFCLNFFQKTLLLVIYINLHNRPWQPFRWVDVFNEHDFGRGLTKGLSGFIPSSGSEEQWFWIFTQSEAWAAILDVSPDAISFQILGPCGPLKWAKLGVQSKIQGPTKFSDKSIRYMYIFIRAINISNKVWRITSIECRNRSMSHLAPAYHLCVILIFLRK